MTRIFFLSAALMLTATAASALDLAAARGRGDVCESPDGFVRAIGHSGEVTALVSEVNARRQQEYAKIASQSGQTPAVAGQLAHKQILANGAPACR